jgi:ribosome-associated heat shock protein Hsp15
MKSRMALNDGPDRHRIDRWLWCARIFKTRSSAAQAVGGGKVHLNGERVRPAHLVRIGDRLSVTLEGVVVDLEIAGLPKRRGPALEARAQYAESAESLTRRAKLREQQRLANLSRPRPDTKPDKKERRQMIKFLRERS